MRALDKKELQEIAIAAVLVSLMYQFGWLLMLMLVPIQVVYFRRGLQAQFLSVAAALVLLILVKLLFALAFTESTINVTLSLLFFLFSTGSMLLWNYLRLYLKGLLPFVLGSMLFGLANVLLFAYVQVNETLVARFLEQLSSVGFELSPIGQGGSAEENFRLVLQLAISSAWFAAALMLLINHAVTVILVSRRPLPDGTMADKLFDRLDKVRLSMNYLWFFIAGWGLVLVSFLAGNTGMLQYFIWNIALFASLLYAVQGYSVAMRFVRTKSPEIRRMFVWVGIICIFVPVLNVLVPVALLLLGLSVYWVHWNNTE